jgi:hypothetical protein
MNLLHLMAGHVNYLPTFKIAVRTLQELFEEIICEKTGEEYPKVKEPRPIQRVHREGGGLTHVFHFLCVFASGNFRGVLSSKAAISLPHRVV